MKTIKFLKLFSLITMTLVLVIMLAPMPLIAGKGNGGQGGGDRGHKDSHASTETAGSESSATESTHDTDSGHGSSGHSGKGNGKSGSSEASQEASTSAGSDDNDTDRGKNGNTSGKGNENGNAQSVGSRGKGENKASTTSDESDDDSDRPAWAGKDGKHDLKPGGGNSGSTTKKGTDFGDLFVMLRTDDGTLALVDALGGVCDAGEDCYTAAILDDGSLFVMLPDVDAPENVQEVELGRLNISRAPDKVLNHSLTEALSKLDGQIITFEDLKLVTDTSGRLLIADENGIITTTAIDSPLENLAIYQALLEAYGDSKTYIGIDGTTYVEVSITTSNEDTAGTTTYSLLVELAAVPYVASAAVAAASDKTGTLNVDEVIYLSTFVGVEEELAELVSTAGDWYDRDEWYDTNLTVLDLSGDDDPEWKDVNLLDPELDLFNTIDTIGDPNSGIDVFTQAADDSVQVLEYVHDNTIKL